VNPRLHKFQASENHEFPVPEKHVSRTLSNLAFRGWRVFLNSPTGGLIYLRDASCSLLSLCPRDPRDSIARTVHNHTFACVINLQHPLFYFTSCSLATCAPTNFLQNKALASPMLVLYMCLRCQKMEASRDASWGTIC
jgi:hypothetical protein